MSTPVLTQVEQSDPLIYVELAGGRVTQLQLGRLAETDHDQALAAIQRILSRALRQHSLDVAASLGLGVESTDPARARVLAFVNERLEKAATATPSPPTGWSPGQADGRDPTRTIHVAVADLAVVVLEAPRGALADPHNAAQGIRAALNQALDRVDSDWDLPAVTSEPPQPDWTGLARQIERHQRGY